MLQVELKKILFHHKGLLLLLIALAAYAVFCVGSGCDSSYVIDRNEDIYLTYMELLTIYNQYYYAKEAPAHRFLMDERGWDTLLTHNGVNVILLLFLLALCVPIFCGEYQCGMAQILHSCRNGRSRLVCYPDYTALHPVPADGADYIFRHHGFYPATFDRRQLSQICPSAPGRSAGRNRLCVGNTDRGWI